MLKKRKMDDKTNEPNQKKKQKINNNNKKEKGENCSICLENINDGRALRSCHTNEGEHPHVFHEECINHWLSLNDNNNNSCPLDRINCLTEVLYNEEFPQPADEQYYDQLIPDNNIHDEGYDENDERNIPEDMLNMNVALNNHTLVNWNENHPNGPWWRKSVCDQDNCNNFQWFLSYEDEDSNQPAFDDGDWDSWNGNLICPECQAGGMVICEVCGERFVGDEQNEAVRDPYTGDDYCEDHFRERYEDDPVIENLDEFITNIREGAYHRHIGGLPLPHTGGGRRRKKRKRKRQKSKKRKRKTKRKKRYQYQTKKRKRKRKRRKKTP